MQRVLEALGNSELVLVKPEQWDDPFENALLSAPIKFSDGNVGGFRGKDFIYGQCWTLHRETDAMWRIYSSDTQRAKIKSTPRKIYDALKASESKFSELRCFIGKVSYHSEKGLLSKFGSIDLLHSNGSGYAESLLYKRNEFSHEKEVRTIYTADQDKTPYLQI